MEQTKVVLSIKSKSSLQRIFVRKLAVNNFSERTHRHSRYSHIFMYRLNPIQILSMVVVEASCCP